MSAKEHHVVIIGGGFGGLYTAKSLRHAPVKVTLIDKRNFHLFQPLLYQVATGGLSPGDIASPLRAVFTHDKHISVLQGEVIDIKPDVNKVILKNGEVAYDSLIVATGSTHHYFGNEHWHDRAPGLKTIEDALDIRQRVLTAFELAERESDPVRRQTYLTFVIVGAGPTGVEMAGTIAELAHSTLRGDFRNINPTEAKVLLLEGVERVLPPYAPDSSEMARKSLEKLGVTIQTNTFVTNIEDDTVTLKQGDHEDQLAAHTIIWAAGMKASVLGQVLGQRAEAPLDRAGRVIVAPDCSVPNHPNIFVIGDLANFAHNTDHPLPGVAQVAMQQGSYVAKLISNRIHGYPNNYPFKYNDKGSLAVIGRNAAVAEIGKMHLSGFPAWFIWVFIHIAYLIEFDNRLMVMFQWAINYFSRKRGARLITKIDALPPVVEPEIDTSDKEPEKVPA